MLAVVVGADAGFDVALDLAHRLHLGVRNLAGHASNVRSLLEAGNHPLLAELLDVVAQTSAVNGLVGEGQNVLTFKHAAERDGAEGVDLPFLVRIGHALRLGEGRNLGSILGGEDSEEVGQIFTITGYVVSS